MIQGTSNMLMQNGILPYDAHSYIYGTPNPNMGYIPQGYAYGPMPKEVYIQPRKKHTLAKVLVGAGVVGGAFYAIKNPQKVRGAYDRAVEYGKKGFEFVREKTGKAIEFVREKAPKFFADVKAGAKEIFNKIFKKADK